MSTIFDEVIDAGFEVCGGKAATYTAPAGSLVPCTVMLDLQEAGVEAGQGRPRTGQASLQVRASEIAEPVKGGVFAIGSVHYTVMDRPRFVEDPEGLVWTMWVVL